jgi:putative DNA primase/helicase
MMANCLRALGATFNNDHAEIDESLWEPEQLIKLWGSTVRKGENSEARPWRQSCIVKMPEIIEVVRTELLQLLAVQVPEKKAMQSPVVEQANVFSKRNGLPPIHEDFDPEQFFEWCQENLPEEYQEFFFRDSEADHDEHDGHHYVMDGCFWSERKHSGDRKKTEFILGDTFGFHCFSDDCDGIGIGDILRKVFKLAGKRYPGTIWPENDDIFEGVEFLDGDTLVPLELEVDISGVAVSESSQPVAESAEAIVASKDPGYNFRFTDTGNAERLVRKFGGYIRYVRDAGEWRFWSGKAWLKDKTGKVDRSAKKVAEEIFKESQGLEDEERDAMWAWGVKTESRERRNAMVDLASKERAVVTLIENYDQDPWLFNLQNGIINLKTGELQPHDPAKMMTKISPVAFDPAAKCPLWQKFLARVQDDDQQMMDFLSRAVGYTLTGDTAIQAMFFLHGDGCNGKGVLTSVIRHLMGSYAENASFDTFVTRKNDSRIRNDLAALAGARYVTASESQDGHHLDEALIKSLTGGDPITARFLHKEFFTFDPAFKLWMSSNYKPAIRGLDWGIWRRVKMIPFEVIIPDEERDETLTEKLKAELPGILNWALKGLADYLKFGMMYPDKVNAATQQYRESQDIVGQFLAAKCLVTPVASIRVSALYDLYKFWAEGAKEYIVKESQFKDAMKKRGFEVKHKNDGSHFLGVGRLATEGTLEGYIDPI